MGTDKQNCGKSSPNTHLNKLAQLEKQIQTHCIYPYFQSNAVQLEVPDYNLEIDGNIDQSSQPA